VGALRKWLLRYVRENWTELLALDMKWARILGAPAPHTLSSWAWERRNASKFWGLFRRFTDFLFLTFAKVPNHCQSAWEAMQPK
jgi:hypothetical protein